MCPALEERRSLPYAGRRLLQRAEVHDVSLAAPLADHGDSGESCVRSAPPSTGSGVARSRSWRAAASSNAERRPGRARGPQLSRGSRRAARSCSLPVRLARVRDRRRRVWALIERWPTPSALFATHAAPSAAAHIAKRPICHGLQRRSPGTAREFALYLAAVAESGCAGTGRGHPPSLSGDDARAKGSSSTRVRAGASRAHAGALGPDGTSVRAARNA